MLQHVVGVAGESEVVGARIELFRTIDPSCRERLLGTNRSKRGPGLVTAEILSCLATRNREVSCLDLVTAREPRDQLSVLVFRAHADDENARSHREPFHRAIQRGGALVRGERAGCRLRRRKVTGQRKPRNAREMSAS